MELYAAALACAIKACKGLTATAQLAQGSDSQGSLDSLTALLPRNEALLQSLMRRPPQYYWCTGEPIYDEDGPLTTCVWQITIGLQSGSITSNPSAGQASHASFLHVHLHALHTDASQ